MVSRTLFALGALGLAAAAPDAPITTNNPAGAAYMATLPESSTTPIRGSVMGTSNNNGTGVEFIVSFINIPATNGPYIYHIHQSPVPANGNCTGTGPHLDPENRGEKPPCDPTQPQQCQVGDLAGKHGKADLTSLSAQSVLFFQGTSGMAIMRSNGTNQACVRYLDLYVSSVLGDPAYFGNRSVVVHDGAGTRLTCANFTLLQPGAGGNGTTPSNSTTSVPYPTSTGSASATTPAVTSSVASAGIPTSSASATASFTAATATPTPFTGEATARGLSAGAALLAAVAFFL